MPFPNVAQGFETLFEPTRIWLFGKRFPTIAYVPSTMEDDPRRPGQPNATHANEFSFTYTAARLNRDPVPMPPKRVERKLRRGTTDGSTEQIFARIYSFSFEGHYYKLPRPLLFLVPDVGAAPDELPANGRIEFTTKLVGLEGRDFQFSTDLRVWAVDRKDLAVCLDVEIGNYQEILLNSMIAWNKGGSRGDMSSRGDLSFRGDLSARGDMSSRGDMSFRGDMIGPHQNR